MKEQRCEGFGQKLDMSQTKLRINEVLTPPKAKLMLILQLKG